MGMIRSWKLPDNDILLPDELRGAKVVLMKEIEQMNKLLLPYVAGELIRCPRCGHDARLDDHIPKKEV